MVPSVARAQLKPVDHSGRPRLLKAALATNKAPAKKKLAQIQACLSDPTCPVRNVTELALDYGFLHLGRFSASYRQQFGELPSDTLKRRV